MGKIFCLLGKSSSGKDTIYKMLLEQKGCSLQTIVPYTTRPIRFGEQEGVEYYFTTEEQVAQLEHLGKIIELRAYDTIHGIWKYFTVDDDQIHLEQSSYLMIGTLESYLKIRDYFGEKDLVPIYIKVDDGLRLQRALDRERKQEVPKYTELCRRFLADDEDFSDAKLAAAGIRKQFENKDLKSTVAAITTYILEMNR